MTSIADVDALVRAGMQAQVPAQPPVVMLPDLQLIALMAASIGGAPKLAVGMACDIFAETLVQVQDGAVKKAVDARKRVQVLSNG